MQVDQLDPGVVSDILPLGDATVAALVAAVTAGFTYAVGRKKSRAELDKLSEEKKSLEAASGVSTAEAAQIISSAAAVTVQPLIERIKEQREEVHFLNTRLTEMREQLHNVRSHAARLQAENELMRTKFRLQGEIPPELPESF